MFARDKEGYVVNLPVAPSSQPHEIKRHKRRAEYGTGSIERHGDYWTVRYRVTVRQDDGTLALAKRRERLCPVDKEHPTLASVRNDDRLAKMMEEILDKVKALEGRIATAPQQAPLALTKVGYFVENVYFPFVKANKDATTYRGYVEMWRNYIKSRFADNYVREVRTCDVQKLLDAIATAHTLSHTTHKHIKSLLSGAFKHAKQQGYYDGQNPVQDTAIPKGGESQETYAYSLEEVEEMLRVLPDSARTVVAVAAFTGMGRSEIRGLTWENYGGKELMVTQAVNSVSKRITGADTQLVIDGTKTKARKAPVPVIPILAQYLDAHRLRCGNPQTGWIFANEASQPLDLNNVLNRQIFPTLRVCAKCGKRETAHTCKRKRADHAFVLDTSRVQWRGWHSFRRGLASNLYELGIEPQVIIAITRHSTDAVLKKHYIKTRRKQAVAAMDKLETAFSTVSAAVN